MASLRTHDIKWQACDRCSICQFTNKKILYRGANRCSILMVGEAPGDTELVLEKPFVGPSGKLLDHTFKEVCRRKNFSNIQVGYTNAIACASMNEETLHLRPPTNTEISNCNDRLYELITIVKPYVIVALGASAKKALKPLETSLEQPILYGVHPASIIRQGERGSLDLARLEETFVEALDALIAVNCGE